MLSFKENNFRFTMTWIYKKVQACNSLSAKFWLKYSTELISYNVTAQLLNSLLRAGTLVFDKMNKFLCFTVLVTVSRGSTESFCLYWVAACTCATVQNIKSPNDNVRGEGLVEEV